MTAHHHAEAESLARVNPGDRVVVVGADCASLELAARARQAGAAVVIVTTAERVMPDLVSQPIAALVEAAHRVNGVRVLTRQRIVARRGTRLELADGRSLHADHVFDTEVAAGETARAMGAHISSRQFDLDIRIAGRIDPAIAPLLRRREDGPGLSALHLADGRLVGIESVNAEPDFAEALRLLAAGVGPLDPVRLADGEVPLADAALAPA